MKNKTWEDLSKEFNAQSETTLREAKILKNKLHNFKRRTKNKCAEIRTHMMGTGRGISETILLNNVDHIISKIIDSQVSELP